ncbi:MAG TPA: LysR family transcriptional regulator [Polyangiaceae bacterium]|nr:LysR family transcriptional regulator [Polyangiaceae bacterium]
MDWLNYHHLFYFWRIAREGGLSRAADRLHLTHSTVSAQLRTLEDFFGEPLFERRGRRLVLTPLGEEVASYADDIFRLGGELVDVARGRSVEKKTPLRVGVVSSMPKSVAYRLMEPAMGTPGYGSVVARQDHLERLLDELASSRLHLVLSDAAPPESGARRVYAHLLGESGLLLYGTKALAKRHRPAFPTSLHGAPLLLPTGHASLRRLIDRWLADRELRPHVTGEFDDAGLMRVAAANGLGLLPVRKALSAEVEDAFALELVGPLEGLVERYYVVSSERRVRHPAVAALIERARADLAAASSVAPRPRRRARVAR